MVVEEVEEQRRQGQGFSGEEVGEHEGTRGTIIVAKGEKLFQSAMLQMGVYLCGQEMYT